MPIYALVRLEGGGDIGETVHKTDVAYGKNLY